jgi:hypothetical protein
MKQLTEEEKIFLARQAEKAYFAVGEIFLWDKDKEKTEVTEWLPLIKAFSATDALRSLFPNPRPKHDRIIQEAYAEVFASKDGQNQDPE